MTATPDQKDATTFCQHCGTAFDTEVPSGRLTDRLIDCRRLWTSINADLEGMPKFVDAKHAASLGRLSGKLEQLARDARRAAELADYIGRHVTR